LNPFLINLLAKVALDRLLPILDAAVAIANSFGKNIYPFS